MRLEEQHPFSALVDRRITLDNAWQTLLLAIVIAHFLLYAAGAA